MEDITMGDSQIMTHSRSAKDEEMTVSEVQVTTLPQASEPTTEPSEDGGEEEQIRWQGGPNDPGSGGGEEEQIRWQGDPEQPGTGSGGSGTGTSGGSGS
jgi:hypothetical protein